MTWCHLKIDMTIAKIVTGEMVISQTDTGYWDLLQGATEALCQLRHRDSHLLKSRNTFFHNFFFFSFYADFSIHSTPRVLGANYRPHFSGLSAPEFSLTTPYFLEVADHHPLKSNFLNAK